jgi:hypothetical protein
MFPFGFSEEKVISIIKQVTEQQTKVNLKAKSEFLKAKFVF